MARDAKAQTPPTEDVDMADAPTSAQPPAPSSQDNGPAPANISEDNDAMAEDEEGAEEDEEEEEEEEDQRVRILPGSTDTAASYEFKLEGHTLGNALRYIIMKNPDVEFCAYAIPHPSEAKMNLRIQTYDTTTASKALEKGLKDLEDLCDVVSEEFWASRDKFMESKQ
ncbi:RBP11-like subunits of RNA polymerase [Xylariaceae sp. FL0804]|nr:RBP11-like subunits of RNA polymerase [Xylariaceae sp. FL0804]